MLLFQLLVMGLKTTGLSEQGPKRRLNDFEANDSAINVAALEGVVIGAGIMFVMIAVLHIWVCFELPGWNGCCSKMKVSEASEKKHDPKRRRNLDPRSTDEKIRMTLVEMAMERDTTEVETDTETRPSLRVSCSECSL